MTTYPFTKETAGKLAARIATHKLKIVSVCMAADVSVQSFNTYRNGTVRMSVDAENNLSNAIDELSGLAFDSEQGADT